MGYGLGERGSIPGKGKRFFSTPQRLDRLWVPTSFLPNGHRGLFPRGQRVRILNVTINLHLVPR
jgi:hypothetical protein